MTSPRPDWDHWFLDLAAFIATRSKDPSTQAGAVIVRPDRTVAAIGYNGFPRGMADSPENLTNREEKLSRVIHCEMNALLSMRNENASGYTLYTYPFAPCDRCAVHMVQGGITRFVAPKMPPDKDHRWGDIMRKAQQFIEECGGTMVLL